MFTPVAVVSGGAFVDWLVRVTEDEADVEFWIALTHEEHLLTLLRAAAPVSLALQHDVADAKVRPVLRCALRNNERYLCALVLKLNASVGQLFTDRLLQSVSIGGLDAEFSLRDWLRLRRH